jgi:hypothetical protein
MFSVQCTVTLSAFATLFNYFSHFDRLDTSRFSHAADGEIALLSLFRNPKASRDDFLGPPNQLSEPGPVFDEIFIGGAHTPLSHF